VKRFYKDVATTELEGGWQVLLDNRPIKSVGGRPQLLPTRALAELLAAEWAAQGEEISAGSFILKDMADYAIDVVGTDRDVAIRQLLPYGETDTLCYRAEPHDPLRQEQDRLWEPLLTAAEQRFDVRFERISGVIHRPQPAGTLLGLETVLAEQDDFALAGLRSLAGLAASLVIGLTALEDGSDIDALWNAAHLEEIWQAERWGLDAEAASLHARRRETFVAAARFVHVARD